MDHLRAGTLCGVGGATRRCAVGQPVASASRAVFTGVQEQWSRSCNESWKKDVISRTLGNEMCKKSGHLQRKAAEKAVSGRRARFSIKVRR